MRAVHVHQRLHGRGVRGLRWRQQETRTVASGKEARGGEAWEASVCSREPREVGESELRNQAADRRVVAAAAAVVKNTHLHCRGSRRARLRMVILCFDWLKLDSRLTEVVSRRVVRSDC